MLRFTTKVTSSPTASRRSESASAATASSAGPSAVASARYSSSLQPPGLRSAARSAAATSVSMRSGARAASSPTRVRMDSQSPKALSRSLRVSVCRPSVSMAVCRSVRPRDSAGLVGLLPRPADGIDVEREAGLRVGQRRDVGAHPRVDPGRAGLDVARLGGQSLNQVEPGLGGHRGELLERRPRPFGVDVVGGQRRDTAPVVDAGAEQSQAFRSRDQVRRRLHPHPRAEHQPGDRDRREEVVEVGVGRRRHRGVVLGAEVLHDHFLDVAELLVQAPDRVQRVRPLGQGLADPTSSPVVNGIDSRPASVSMRNRTAGSLSGLP